MLTTPYYRLWLLLCCVMLGGVFTQAQANPLVPSAQKWGSVSGKNFLPADQALRLIAEQEGDQLTLHFKVEPEHYLYRDRFRFESRDPNVQIGTPAFPRDGEWKEDPTFGRVQVYHEDITIKVPVRGEGEVKITWQGCADAGLCYPPQSELVPIIGAPPIEKANTVKASTVKTSADKSSAEQTAVLADKSVQKPEEKTAAQLINSAAENTAAQSDVNTTTNTTTSTQNSAALLPNDTQNRLFGDTSRPVVLLTLFVIGLGLALTPCVLPMLPILSGIIARQHTRSTKRGFLLSVSYVFGVAVTYALTGLLVAVFGASANLPMWFQHPIILSAFAALFIALALAMFGLYELRLPHAIQNKFDALSRRFEGGDYIGSFIMGFFSALVVSPCVSAPLAGVLLYISTTGDAVLGASGLFVMALGMGVPLIILGTSEGKFLPKAGKWMDAVKIFFGVLLVGVAISLVARLIPGQYAMLLWAALAVAYGFWLLHSSKSPIIRLIGVLLTVYAGLLMGGAYQGQTDPLRPLPKNTQNAHVTFAPVKTVADVEAAVLQAKTSGKTIMLDFYADWCISCKIMERDVFNHDSIAPRLNEYVLLQADVTANDEADRELMKHYQLFGPPSMLFFKDGAEIQTARIQGEMNQTQFLNHINQHGL